MISTRDLSKLPDIDGLRRLLQSLAMLDAILQPEWVFRWYSFNSKWSKGDQMGSMRNNHADDFFVHFTKAGCWLQGFWHESPMSPWRESPPELWPGILDKVPDVFVPSVAEPAFATHEHTTFCFWRQYGDTEWQISDIDYPIGEEDPDGSEWMLSILDGQPETYLPHAGQISILEPSVSAIRHVYEHKPLTAEIVEALNPEMTLLDIEHDIAEIGYPT